MARTLKRRVTRRPVPVILMYHRVATASADPWELAVAPAIFERQMGSLAKQRRVLQLGEFVARLVARTLPADAAAITFDDGYACNVLVAAPILSRLGLPATFFLVTGQLGSKEEFWNDALERVVFDPAAGGEAILTAGDVVVTANLGAAKPGSDTKWRAMVDAPRNSRERAYLRLWEVLKRLPSVEQYRAIDAIAGQVGSHRAPRTTHRAMTKDEAAMLARTPGFEICGHTHTHLSLPLWDAATQRTEMRRSRDICEQIAGRDCTAFAYPYGDHSQLTVECARDSGMTAALTTSPRPVKLSDHALALPRLMARNDSEIICWDH